MADRNNEDRSLLTNNRNNNSNNTSDNSSLYLEQMLDILSDVVTSFNALQKEIKRSSKSDSGDIKTLVNTINKLNSNIVQQNKIVEDNTKATKEFDSKTNTETKEFNTELNELKTKFALFNQVSNNLIKECNGNVDNLKEIDKNQYYFAKEQADAIAKQVDFIQTHTVEEIRQQKYLDKIRQENLSESEKIFKESSEKYAKAVLDVQTALSKAETKEEKELLENKRELIEQERKLAESRFESNKKLDTFMAKANQERINKEKANQERIDKIRSSFSNRDDLKGDQIKSINTKIEDFSKLINEDNLAGSGFNDIMTNLFSKLEESIISNDENQYDAIKSQIELYKSASKSLEEKGLSANTIDSLVTNSIANNLKDNKNVLSPTNQRNAFEAMLSKSDMLKKLADTKNSSLYYQNELQSKLADGNISEEEKEKLNNENNRISKEIELIDNLTSEMSELFSNIAKGDLKSAKANEKNIDKFKKSLSKLDESALKLDGAGENAKKSLSPGGQIVKLLGDGVKKLITETINYGTQLTTGALQSLQSTYESAGTDIMQTNLYTRDTVQSMMRDFGAELIAKGISGVSTVDVTEYAASIANAGITAQDELTDMAEIMSEIALVNPQMKAAFTNEDMIKEYHRIYTEAVANGQDAAEVLYDNLTSQAKSVRGVTDEVGNAFWSVNGRLIELESTLSNARTTYELDNEEREQLRNATYALAAQVGTDTTDFNAWIQKFLDLSKEPIRSDVQSIIEGITYGSDILNALQAGNFAEVMSKSYASLLTFDSTNGYDAGHEYLMNQLGIDNESLNKIKQNKEYWDEQGNFDVQKFLAKFEETYAAAQAGGSYNQKYEELVIEGKGQTVENELSKETINLMTDNFVDLLETDVPKAVQAEIAAINFAANMLNEGISAAADLLLGGLESLGSLSGGSSALNSLVGGVGAAGPVGAGIAAFGGGLMIGKWLNDTFKISENIVEALHTDLPETIMDKEQEYLDEQLPKVRDDVESLVTEMEQSNLYSKQLVDFEKQRIEHTAEKRAKASASASFLKISLPTSIAEGTEALSMENPDKYEYNSMSSLLGKSDEEIEKVGSYALKTGDITSEQYNNLITNVREAEANLQSLAANIAGGAVKAGTTAKPGENATARSTYLDNQINDLSNEDFDSDTKDYIRAIATQQIESIDKQAQVLDNFNNTFGDDLYQVYLKSEQYKDSEGDNAWSKAWTEIIGNSIEANKYHELNTVPEAEKDFIVDDVNKRVTVLPGVYTRSNNSGENSALNANVDYLPQNWGRFATGLDNVPYDDYPALLHEGERVLTAQETDMYDNIISETYDNVNSLPELITSLINDNTAKNNSDITYAINNQTSNVTQLITNIIGLLQLIAGNTNKFNSSNSNNNKNSSNFVNAVLSGSLDINDYINQSIYTV